jgi:Peroxiredoxin
VTFSEKKTQVSSLGYKPKDVASDFRLRDVSGEMVSLSDYSDAKGFIVIFTCNHCPYSVAYEDRIMELHDRYEVQGFPVVAINPNDGIAYPEDSYENMKKRAKEKGFRFRYLHDESQKVAKMYGAKRTPHVFILRKVGNKLRVEYIGAIDDNPDAQGDIRHKYVEEAMNRILRGEEPDPNLTKAIGCTIKWKK